MSDLRSGYDEDSLPWLQEVEDEDAPSGISARTMLLGLVIVAVVVALIAAAFFWVGSRNGGVAGEPELIRAPDTPYKVKPTDPGGLDIAGESQATFDTSAGRDVDSRLDLRGTGREDIVTPPPDVEPKRIPPNETKEPVPAEKPAPPPSPKPSGASGSVIQLGAYSNSAQAERAWAALSTRFAVLGGMTKIVVPYSANGSSGYRLRAAASSPDAARQACRAIEAGGESCFIAR
ncbi:MAG TPA: SPOR domain-containing protein [Sphingomicrobium sp.]|nr:SPOR domain-containing protein [Sphingomicrobium sp.]